MFKIRIRRKSAPKVSILDLKQPKANFNRYECLKLISNTQQHWKKFLQNELEMSSTIIAFQNVQISMRVDAQKKLMLRETFMLKKEIIRLIINQQHEAIVQKLELLRKLSPSDDGLATLFLDFYNIQQYILAHKLEYRKQTIKHIKEKMEKYSQKLEKQKGCIIYGRILYITALHLIKLDGVLIQNSDIFIVSQALVSKKRQLCMVPNEVNKKVLESLLFLTFQFYKILYLLKKDQDLIVLHYNQIQAYISIYKTKCGNYTQFEDTFEIAQKIDKIKPMSLNLKVYDDHDRRRVLSLQHTQSELMKNHFSLQNTNVLSSQINENMFYRQRKALMRINSIDSSYDKNQNQLSSNQSKESKDQRENGDQSSIMRKIMTVNKQYEDENASLADKFSFNFIKPENSSILHGNFSIVFDETFSQFKVKIKITRRQEYVGLFETIYHSLQKPKNLVDCAKKLWRVIKQRFYTDKTEFLPNIFSFQYPPFKDLPNHINLTCELPILVRVHEMLLHYLRKQSLTTKINGQMIVFPSSRPEQGPQTTQQQLKIFAKRYGFISFNKRLHRNHSLYDKNLFGTSNYDPKKELNMTFIVMEQNQHYMASVLIQNRIVKKFVISNVNQKHVKSQTNVWQFQKDLCRLYKLTQGEERKKRIKIIVDQIQNHKQENQYFKGEEIYIGNKQATESIEEELEVMKSPILETRINQIKRYRRFDYEKFKQKINSETLLVVRTIRIENKLHLFHEEAQPTYTRYFDNRREFIVCSESKEKLFCYKKFRLYRTVLFKDCQDSSLYTKISCIKNKNDDTKRQIKIKKQKITSEWVKTKIGKTKKGKKFYFLNIFKWRMKTVIKIYAFQSLKSYIGIIQLGNGDQLCIDIEDEKAIINGIEVKEFTSCRSQICDIQLYLEQQLINNK